MGESTVLATAASVQQLAADLGLSEAAYARAREVAKLTPDAAAWRRYISRFLMAVGAALIVAGITAFVAWNWADLAVVYKFAMIQGLIAACALLTWRAGIDSIGGKASLFGVAFLIGVLLALFGQTYQTGADPYGLFLVWGILVVPLAVVGRQAGLWILALVLANLTVIMYWTQVVDPPDGWWGLNQLLGPLVWLSTTILDSTLASVVFAVNLAALAVWETFVGRHSYEQAPFLHSRLFPRIAALIALTCVAIPTTIILFSASFFDNEGKLTILSPVLYLAASVGGLYYFDVWRRDLLILTLIVFGGIMVITSTFVRHLLDDFGDTLALAVLLIGQVAGAAYWLRTVSKRWGATA